MFNRRNPMKYFSGSALARLPIYKLAAGSMAVVMTVGVGAGVFAAGYVPQSEPAPQPVATATPTPTPTPTATVTLKWAYILENAGARFELTTFGL